MQRLRRLAVPLALLTLGVSSAASAQGATFIAFMTNAQENPPVVPTLDVAEGRDGNRQRPSFRWEQGDVPPPASGVGKVIGSLLITST